MGEGHDPQNFEIFLNIYNYFNVFKFYTKVSKKSFNWTNEIFKNMNDSKLGGISYHLNIFETILL